MNCASLGSLLTKLEPAATPYAEILTQDVPDCMVRRWTLGEIVTAFARDFKITNLEEHPSWDHAQVPGTFTLTASAV